jgi:hypothetical protein
MSLAELRRLDVQTGDFIARAASQKQILLIVLAVSVILASSSPTSRCRPLNGRCTGWSWPPTSSVPAT